MERLGRNRAMEKEVGIPPSAHARGCPEASFVDEKAHPRSLAVAVAFENQTMAQEKLEERHPLIFHRVVCEVLARRKSLDGHHANFHERRRSFGTNQGKMSEQMKCTEHLDLNEVPATFRGLRAFADRF